MRRGWPPDNGPAPHTEGPGRPRSIFAATRRQTPRARSSWCPTPGAQYGFFFLCHPPMESISNLSRGLFFHRFATKKRAARLIIAPPTCHYAYTPPTTPGCLFRWHEICGGANRQEMQADVAHPECRNEIEDASTNSALLLYGPMPGTPTGRVQLSNRGKQLGLSRRTRTPTGNAGGCVGGSRRHGGGGGGPLKNPHRWDFVEADRWIFHALPSKSSGPLSAR